MNSTVIFNVTQINNKINYLLESNFNSIFIKGEISSLVIYNSGHAYFTLKDNLSEISCVLFNYVENKNNIILKEHIEVIAFGQINVYKAKGKMQFQVRSVHIGKEGNLWQQYTALKNKLEKEGIFNLESKKNIPLIPEKIAIICSQKGAVIHDIINILNRRSPYIDILITDTKTQGSLAVNDIVNKIKSLNEIYNVDIIIIARGGGSIEDMAPFNNEEVVREIYQSNIPIITAIGHQSDFTLSDFASDKRASTPSEAAEICAMDINVIRANLNTLDNKLVLLLQSLIQKKYNMINTNYLRLSSKNPKLIVRIFQDKIDYISTQLKKELFDSFKIYSNKLELFKNILLKYDIGKLKQRGFSLVRKNKKLINSTKQVKINDQILVELSDGNINVKVNTIDEKK